MSPLRILAGLAFAGSCIFQASADDIVTSKSGYGGIIDARAFATDNATVTTTVLQDALDYAAAHGIGTVKLGARYTSTLGNINVPAYTKLDLGGASVGKITTTRNYTLASGIQGVLALGSAGTITCGIGATIQNGNILAAGGSYSPTTFYPTTTRDGQNVQTAEATAGTAITASNPSCHLNNLSILGFNVGAALSSQHIQLVDVFIDAKTCISLNGAEDDQHERVICKSLLTQGLDRQSPLLYLAGSGDGSNQYEFTWDVSATTYTLADGDKFYVVPDDGGGGESAAGGWPIVSAATRANGEKGCNRVAGCAGGKLSGSSANATVLAASWSGTTADRAGDYFVTVTPGTTGTVSVGQAVSGTGIASQRHRRGGLERSGPHLSHPACGSQHHSRNPGPGSASPSPIMPSRHRTRLSSRPAIVPAPGLIVRIRPARKSRTPRCSRTTSGFMRAMAAATSAFSI
jgi:hypothetical protein